MQLDWRGPLLEALYRAHAHMGIYALTHMPVGCVLLLLQQLVDSLAPNFVSELAAATARSTGVEHRLSVTAVPWHIGFKRWRGFILCSKGSE